MEYINMKYPDEVGKTPTHFGVQACIAAALAPYREPFAEAARETNPGKKEEKMKKAWDNLMKVDKFSTRAYML